MNVSHPPSVSALFATFWRSLAWEEADNTVPVLINQLHRVLEQWVKRDERDPDRSACQALLAASYWQLGQCVRAVEVATVSAGHPLSQWVLGISEVRQGRARQALHYLAQALGHYPALDALILDSLWEARPLCFEGVAGLAPSSAGLKGRWSVLAIRALASYGRFQGGQVAHYGKMLACAVLSRSRWQPCLNQLVAQFPGSALWGVLLGDAQLMTTNHYGLAVSHYRRVLERHPGHLEALRRLIAAALAQNDVLDAHLLVDRLATLLPLDPEVACHRGNLAMVREEYVEAISHYRNALLLGGDPRWQAKLLHTIADVYLDHLQEPLAAQQALLHALSLVPEDLATRHRLCALLNQQDQLETARLLCKQAVAARPHLAPWHTSLGFLAWRQEDLAGAKHAYQQALSLNPNDEIAANNLAVIYLDLEATPLLAIPLLEGIASRQPRHALAYFNLGRAYSLSGRSLEAAQSYRQAQAINEVTGELDANELSQRIADLFRADSLSDSGITVP